MVRQSRILATVSLIAVLLTLLAGCIEPVALPPEAKPRTTPETPTPSREPTFPEMPLPKHADPMSPTEALPETTPEAKAPTKEVGFPVIPPIKDADPSVRHEETFQVPTRLLVMETLGRVKVGWDTDSVEDIHIDVGHKMIVGTKVEINVVADGCPLEMYGPSMSHRSGVHIVSKGDPFLPFLQIDKKSIPSSKEAVIQAHITIFETAIPPQHMWDIQIDGRYRVLWERTVEGRWSEE